MKNLHLEHPEDSILGGDLTVLDWFTSIDNTISAKIDGSPAIVWGTEPKTGKFFVGTKSVFNKKLIKINYDHKTIDKNHQGEVADILHKCLDFLPVTTGIYQADFIGFGGDFSFRPNTITYDFPEELSQEVILAPHTFYTTESGDLRDAIAHPLESRLCDTPDVMFVQPVVILDKDRQDIVDLCKFARQMATLCEFPKDNATINRIKKQINVCIREDIEIDELTQDALAHDNKVDVNVLRLWKLVEAIKLEFFSHILRYDEIECYIENEECDHEGYVMWNKYGTFKIINRVVFSVANFNLSKNR